MKDTLSRITRDHISDGVSRTSSLMTTTAPPATSGSNACSIEASNEQEMNSAARKPAFTSKSFAIAEILLARLACVTTTPFGVPVEPEV